MEKTKLSRDAAANLYATYQLILSSPEMLVSAAAQRGITIRQAYESVIEEIAQLDREMKGSG